MDEVHKAYLAGYFDADGSVAAGLSGLGYNNVRVVIRVAGRDDALLQELEFVYGGHLHHQVLNRERRYTIWEWSLYGRSAIPFLEGVLPYLRLKKRQAELALEIVKTMGTRGSNPSLKVKIYRAKLALEICQLNQANKSFPKETTAIERLREFIGKEEGRPLPQNLTRT